MTKNYFITGGAGFIGSNYVSRLLERGEKVIIYDNLSRAGSSRNLAWLREKYGEQAFQLIVGDVRDANLLTASMPQRRRHRPPGGTGGSDHLGHKSPGGFRDQCPGDLQCA